MNIASALTIIGLLTALTNIIVQVLKQALWDKLPTNLLALLIAEALTIPSGVAYCQHYGIQMLWYYYLALVVLGFCVAYAAMFGFDKLKEILNWKEPKR